MARIRMGQCHVPFERIVDPTDEDRQREQLWQDLFRQEPINIICPAKYARRGDVLVIGSFHRWTTEELHRNIRIGNVETRIFDSVVTGGVFRYIDDSPEGTSLSYIERIQANVTLNAYARKIQRAWRRSRVDVQ